MSYDHISFNLQDIHQKIKEAVGRKKETSHEPRLVAVSKLHPKDAVVAAYAAGHRVFGENYVQELVEKATDPVILESCPDIQWHLIGHLQTNKVNLLLTAPGLSVVESVDSEKLATTLDKSWSKTDRGYRLKVMVQVNTSGEENKSGIHPSQVSSLVSFILNKCPGLQVIGLMTIGAYDYDISQGPNPDFLRLISCRKTICEEIGLKEHDLELSMGMSADFEQAIELGSTNIRVGTTIFGQRPPKQHH